MIEIKAVGLTLGQGLPMKLKSKCCKRFRKKPKCCKNCPLLAQLSGKARKKSLSKRRRLVKKAA